MTVTDQGHPRTTAVGRLLVVLGMTGFAISQPLLSLFGDQPVFFIARALDGWSLVAFALIVALVPPLGLWAVSQLVYLGSERIGGALHLASVIGLAMLVIAPLVRSAGIERVVLMWVASAIMASVGGALYWRFRTLGTWLTYTAVLPFVAVGLFLGFSEAGELVRPPEASTAVSADGSEIPPVVFLMFDELPTESLLDDSGAIDRERFPNFAAFGDQATWHSQYSSVGSLTYLAVPSVLTGSEPAVDAQPTLRDYPDNLFTFLQPTHDLVAFETITDLCGLPECRGASGRASLSLTIRDAIDLFKERFESHEREVGFIAEFTKEFVPSSEVDLAGQEHNEELTSSLDRLPGLVPKRFAEFVNGLDNSSDTDLNYLHLSVPHGPWSVHPDGSRYRWAAPFLKGYPASETLDVEYLAALSEQRHLLQAEWADRLLGVLIAKLKGTDRYEDSLIVITADHGISFAESSYGRAVTPVTVRGIAYVPLLIKAPGQTEGTVDTSNLMSTDVLPTMADHLGLALPFDVAGSAAGSPDIDDRGSAKYLYNVQGGFASDGFSYDFDGIVEFDAATGQPDATDRWTGTSYDTSRPIDGLLALAGIDAFVGRSLDDLTSATSGAARVRWAEDFVEPNDDQLPPGVVIGALKGGTTGEAILVAIDGIVVTGSPLYTLDETPNSFAALVPPGALDRSGNELRIAVVGEGVVTEIRHIR